MWSLTGSTEALEPPNTPYGPYPCKAITKIYWNQDTDGDTWTVFRDDLSLLQDRETKAVVLNLFGKLPNLMHLKT